MADPKGIANMFLQAYGQAFQSESQQTHTATKNPGPEWWRARRRRARTPRGAAAPIPARCHAAGRPNECTPGGLCPLCEPKHARTAALTLSSSRPLSPHTFCFPLAAADLATLASFYGADSVFCLDGQAVEGQQQIATNVIAPRVSVCARGAVGRETGCPLPNRPGSHHHPPSFAQFAGGPIALRVVSMDAQLVKPTQNQIVVFLTGESSDRPVRVVVGGASEEQSRVRPPPPSRGH